MEAGLLLFILVDTLCVVSLIYQVLDLRQTVTRIAEVQRDITGKGEE